MKVKGWAVINKIDGRILECAPLDHIHIFNIIYAKPLKDKVVTIEPCIIILKKAVK